MGIKRSTQKEGSDLLFWNLRRYLDYLNCSQAYVYWKDIGTPAIVCRVPRKVHKESREFQSLHGVVIEYGGQFYNTLSKLVCCMDNSSVPDLYNWKDKISVAPIGATALRETLASMIRDMDLRQVYLDAFSNLCSLYFPCTVNYTNVSYFYNLFCSQYSSKLDHSQQVVITRVADILRQRSLHLQQLAMSRKQLLGACPIQMILN